MRYRGTLLLDLRQNLDDIWNGIRKRRREEIRRASRLGIKIELNPSRKIREEWYFAFLHQMAHLSQSVPEERVARNLGLDDGKVRICLFTASTGDEWLSGEYFNVNNARAGGGKSLAMAYSVNKKEKKLTGIAHSLLIWQSIVWAKKRGYVEYDFGGWNCYRPDQEGINKWKESFGGNVWWWATDEEPLSEQIEMQQKAMIDPDKAIVWFDDGHVSLHEYGLRLFEMLGVKPIVALVTGRVGEMLEVSQYLEYPIMDVPQLKALIDAGWEIASHSETHRRFTELSLEEAKTEMTESKRWIKENLGIEATKFVAPYNDMTPEQMEAASEIYEYVRPRIPPRPPQPGGIHGIFHLVRKFNNTYSLTSAMPSDLGFRNYMSMKLSGKIDGFDRIIPDFSSPEKINYITYNSPSTILLYSGSKLQEAEKEAFQTYLHPPGRLLDLGCGTGRTTVHLARKGLDVVGVDLAPRMIEAAKRYYPELDFKIGDASDLGAFDDGSFDYVLFSFNGLDCLIPLEKRFQCLREIHRVLKEDGIFIYSTHSHEWMRTHPNHNRVFDDHHFLHEGPYGPTIVYASNPEEQREQLKEFGFELLQVYERVSAWTYYVAEKGAGPRETKMAHLEFACPHCEENIKVMAAKDELREFLDGERELVKLWIEKGDKILDPDIPVARRKIEETEKSSRA